SRILDRLHHHKIFVNTVCTYFMFYSFELQMAGVILLTAMAIGGVSLWLKRRRAQKEIDEEKNDEPQKYE
ncbi:MAG: hypothetical protein PVG43_06805, partial [Nitrosopumilaceae archaeon]